MPEVSIYNLGSRTIKIEATTRPLLWHLQQNRIDWMHACGGKGRCTTCKVVVMEGIANTAPLSTAEERYRKSGELLENERLACQLLIAGNVTVRVPDESKLPHLHYSDDPG
jgi:2Fe-2S ferredoxin